ncbi:DUF2087 domain-containing protein [Clostridium sp. CS001]|uniref:DUF2087 domain-containing protein n=1 Tax=Clostridium sp. CS001 TaxID=2880648 RepID=UPI001CF3D874|nr:DUF2087 domain-containing protein [Clostridium sp. CS001]MCB2289424.1 DUF2087 domain-containing protein [Clostridium sp. CS001]
MDIKENEVFWGATIAEVEKGFVENNGEYKCIICEETFEKGRIYEIKSELYDARMATELHIEEKHGSMLEYLLGLNSAFTGVSEVQGAIITLISQGLSDKDVAIKVGVAQSTIRNHRYKLREKEKQAKLFLAMMELLSKNTNKKINKLEDAVICDASMTATSLDDRYNITDKEKKDTIHNCIDDSGALKNYPAKEKKKIIVLEAIVKTFSRGRHYSEKEVNRVLKRMYEDYATLRRDLIGYGFIERTNDGSSYWVKE